MKKVMLCSICNISSGNCSEDCSFCTQSAYHKADIVKFKEKELSQIVLEAKLAKQHKALGFCLVTAGQRLDDKKLEFVVKAAKAVKKEVPELMLIGCNGLATKESLMELKKAGIQSYNHNLETSESFYPQICTTHSWEQRYNTNLYAKEVGLMLCCGGIYGIGESLEDRKDFLKALLSLKPFSSPVNFFISNKALPLKLEKLSADEALNIVKDTRKTLKNTRIMVAGGREAVLQDRQYEIFEAGADAVVLGDYLTAKGEKLSDDLSHIKSLGYEFATQCH